MFFEKGDGTNLLYCKSAAKVMREAVSLGASFAAHGSSIRMFACVETGDSESTRRCLKMKRHVSRFMNLSTVIARLILPILWRHSSQIASPQPTSLACLRPGTLKLRERNSKDMTR